MLCYFIYGWRVCNKWNYLKYLVKHTDYIVHLPCPNVAFVLICGQKMAMIVELTTTGFGYISRKCATNQHKHTFEPEATSTNNKVLHVHSF